MKKAKKGGSKIPIILGVAAAAVILIGGGVGAAFALKKKKEEKKEGGDGSSSGRTYKRVDGFLTGLPEKVTSDATAMLFVSEADSKKRCDEMGSARCNSIDVIWADDGGQAMALYWPTVRGFVSNPELPSKVYSWYIEPTDRKLESIKM